jgi:hypothetical protein
MFGINYIYNIFFKVTCRGMTTQQLYLMYTVFLKFNHNLTFKQYQIYVYLYTRTFVNVDSDFLFLGKFFFLKTSKLLRLDKVLYGNIKQCQRTTTNKQDFDPSEFWKKFKKLKRPKTEDKYDEHYIIDYMAKLAKYNKLGFIIIHDSFFLIRVRSEMFLKNLVKFNKPLLITPKYSSSSINKYISVSNLGNFEFQFLRKNKVYNKGRYSRCRQNYRTGVYMCMYLSVVSIFGLYYWFYKFSFNFTYLWWVFIAFVASFFLPKVIKYRLYEPMTLISKVFDFFKWGFMVLKSLFF